MGDSLYNELCSKTDFAEMLSELFVKKLKEKNLNVDFKFEPIQFFPVRYKLSVDGYKYILGVWLDMVIPYKFYFSIVALRMGTQKKSIHFNIYTPKMCVQLLQHLTKTEVLNEFDSITYLDRFVNLFLELHTFNINGGSKNGA